ncbi:hypothetical protein KY290_037278 [Solanum tuberosum]|uniref:Nucleic acid binding protein n=1 Tax=Solanum tuberosum TaxID=4113 RepID=A0ABQ7TX25_SOLTU|nr:hypothetical protein KY285_036575 [Solanum tuberosum]KAH0738573.1 hypothetical protein KY290_037278 [Solanum tuberosum]
MVDAAAINSVTRPLPETTGAHTGVDAHHPLHLQACDTPGSDNSSLVNEAMALFSNNKNSMSRSIFNSNSGSNPSLGTDSRSSQKSHTNSHLYCDYCNWKGHVRSICYKLHAYPADWKGKRRTTTGLIPDANLARAATGNNQLMQYSVRSAEGSINSSHGSTHFRPPGSGSSSNAPSHAFMSNHYAPQVQQHPHFSPQQY